MEMENFEKAQTLIHNRAEMECFYGELLRAVAAFKIQKAPYDDVFECKKTCDFLMEYIDAKKQKAFVESDRLFQEI